MAEVTVRVKINRTFTFNVSATNESEAIDAIVDLSEAHIRFLDACTEEFTIEEAEYDIPEPDYEEDQCK